MINIQKSYLVYFSPNQFILSSLVHFGSIWSTLVLLGPFIHIGPILSTSVLFHPHWSYSVHSTLVLFGSHLSYSVHSVNLGPIKSTLVLFHPIWSYSIHFGHIQSYLFLFGPYVHFGPNLSIRSYSVHMSTLVLICPFVLIRSTSVLIRSTSVHLVPIRSYSIHSIYLVHLYPLLSILCTYI